MQSYNDVDSLFDEYPDDDGEYPDEPDSTELSFDDAVEIYLRTFPDDAQMHYPARKHSKFSSRQNAWSLGEEDRHLCFVSASTLTAWKGMHDK